MQYNYCKFTLIKKRLIYYYCIYLLSVFGEDKLFILMDIPCFEKSESKLKDFVNHFTNHKILYITYRDTKILYFY